MVTNAWLMALVLGLGGWLDLPGGHRAVVLHQLGVAVAASALMLVATTPVALVASAGRGYLAPLACAMAGLVLAQIAAALGWGALVPWSVPAVAAGLTPGVTLGTASVLVVLVTGGGAVAGTVAWWNSGRADG